MWDSSYIGELCVRCGAKKTTMVWKLLSPSLDMISQIWKVLRDRGIILILWYKNHLSSIDTRRFRANFVRKKILKKSWFSAESHVISSYLQKCILRTKPSSKTRLRSTMAITKPSVKPKLPKIFKNMGVCEKTLYVWMGKIDTNGVVSRKSCKLPSSKCSMICQPKSRKLRLMDWTPFFNIDTCQITSQIWNILWYLINFSGFLNKL